MFDASLDRINEDLQGVEASLGALRVLVRYNDNQMAQMGHNGPPLVERNRGTQHCIYPHPPVRVFCSFFWDKNHFQPFLIRSYGIRLPPFRNISVTIRIMQVLVVSGLLI